jgi:hypothetical protein
MTCSLFKSELARLRKEKDAEIKRLKKELNEEKLKNLANETMINLAERRFHIQVRKKSGCQVIKELSQMEAPSTHKKNLVSFLCGYLGISRQGYYRHVDRTLEREVLRTSIVLYCPGSAS